MGLMCWLCPSRSSPDARRGVTPRSRLGAGPGALPLGGSRSAHKGDGGTACILKASGRVRGTAPRLSDGSLVGASALSRAVLLRAGGHGCGFCFPPLLLLQRILGPEPASQSSRQVAMVLPAPWGLVGKVAFGGGLTLLKSSLDGARRNENICDRHSGPQRNRPAPQGQSGPWRGLGGLLSRAASALPDSSALSAPGPSAQRRLPQWEGFPRNEASPRTFN